MNIPAELKYSKDHEWVRVEGNVAVIGITDHAQSELGDIVFVDINTEGEDVAQEAVFGTIEAVKTVSDLFMPVSGKVVEVTPALADDPSGRNKGRPGAGRPADRGAIPGVARVRQRLAGCWTGSCAVPVCGLPYGQCWCWCSR